MVEKCPKPGCGAQRLIGNPCTDWDCPQHTVSAEEYRRSQAEVKSLALNATALASINARLSEEVERLTGLVSESEAHRYKAAGELIARALEAETRAEAAEAEVERLRAANAVSKSNAQWLADRAEREEARADEAKARVKVLEEARGYHGHKTMADGSHVPITKDEAAALMDHLAAIQSRREADMPTARDALSAIIAAEERLRDLGWWRGGGLRVRRGDDCAVIQQGSTGMWRGRYQDDGKYVLFGDSVCGPRDCWLKPLAELTADERAWIEECDKREAEAQEAFHRRMADHRAALPTHKEG